MVYGKSYETRWYKCHLLIATEKLININTDRTNVTNKKEQKLLGIKLIDPYLSNVTLSKATCTSKNSQLYGPSSEGFNESVYYIPVRLLSFNLDVT